MEPTPPLPPGLYLVATPIGNLGDITYRAVNILEAVDLIYCEDTRHSIKLLKHLNIDKPLKACHDHNETRIAQQIADEVEQGKSIALISDAGTPAINDPGFRAVRECRKRKLEVTSAPGPSAVIAALSVSGLPSDQFHFLGFAPPKKAARVNFFKKHEDSDATMILYESVHRIESSLRDIETALGPDRTICVARELTKNFEEIHTGPITQVAPIVLKSARKGEFVILIAKKDYSLEG